MPKPILLHQPMSARMVTNWDDMEELWRYGIEEKMALEASEHPVLMADSTSTTPSERCASVSMCLISHYPVLHCSWSVCMYIDIGMHVYT